MWWRTPSPVVRGTVIMAVLIGWMCLIPRAPVLRSFSDEFRTLIAFTPGILFLVFWSGFWLIRALSFVLFPRTLKRYFDSRTDLTREECEALENAALAIHYGREEKALNGLEELCYREGKSPAQKMARCMRTWAGACLVWRHRRALGIGFENFPQLHAIFFTHHALRMHLRRHALAQELETVSAGDLDEMARRYADLTEFLVAQWNDVDSPFREKAAQSMRRLTGKRFWYANARRTHSWWEAFKPAFRRGGGPLHIGTRLLRMHSYAEGMRLIERLGKDGMLSRETETVGRASTMLAYLSRAGGQGTIEELPRFFRDLHLVCENPSYLRFPLVTYEQPEVISWCRRSKELREAKKEFVDDLFSLWELCGQDISPWMNYLLNRIMGLKKRSMRIGYWRKEWRARRNDFELYIECLMEGVVAASDRNYDAAERAFIQASKMEPQDCTPLVNIVYVRIVSGRENQARELAGEIVHRFPNDSLAFVSLGKLFATMLDDIPEAQRLYLRARELQPTETEPLILLGELKLVEGQYSESQRYFDLALQLDNTSYDVRLGLSRLYLETRRYDRAIEHLQSVAREGRGEYSNLAHYHLYRTYREMNDGGHAVEFLDKVPTTFFKEPDDLDDIACYLESEKLFAKARLYSERAMLLRVKGRGKDGGTETTRHS